MNITVIQQRIIFEEEKILFVCMGTIILCTSIFYITPLTTPTPSTEKSEYTLNTKLPARLIITRIGVDTRVEYVGLTQAGSMDTPKALANVAWPNTSRIPGESGSSVISGYYGWKTKQKSVFDKLYMMRKGDIISVKKENGDVVSFVVKDIKMLRTNEDSAVVFNSQDNVAHLNLITCAGAWDKVIGNYPSRLVVFTDKIEK